MILFSRYRRLHLSVDTRPETCSNRVYVQLIFYFSQLSGISIAQKQLTCPKKLFWTSKNSYKGYFVETKQIKLTTASPTPNFECLTSNMSCLHPIKTCSFLTCTCLNTTDGNLVITTTKHTKWHQWVLNRSIWQNSFFYCQAMKRFCVWEMVKRKKKHLKMNNAKMYCYI